jgi:cytochrome c biogenesis protein CcmG/thiol:disulfide interchange protein DsbE
MTRVLYLVPAALFVGLCYLLFASLRSPPPNELPSPLIGRAAPALKLPSLDEHAAAFTRADLLAGHVTVINVWASWCAPCREEAPVLASLAGLDGVALYGIVYKDKPLLARTFLAETGNPFSRLDLDADGRAGIDWGVYDVPETFVVDGRGIVRLRYSGPITPDVLTGTVLPAIEAARQAQSSAAR